MKNLVCKFVVWLFLVVFFFCNTAMAEMDDSLDPVARLTALIIETKYAAAEELYQSEIKGSILLS